MVTNAPADKRKAFTRALFSTVYQVESVNPGSTEESGSETGSELKSTGTTTSSFVEKGEKVDVDKKQEGKNKRGYETEKAVNIENNDEKKEVEKSVSLSVTEPVSKVTVASFASVVELEKANEKEMEMEIAKQKEKEEEKKKEVEMAKQKVKEEEKKKEEEIAKQKEKEEEKKKEEEMEIAKQKEKEEEKKKEVEIAKQKEKEEEKKKEEEIAKQKEKEEEKKEVTVSVPVSASATEAVPREKETVTGIVLNKENEMQKEKEMVKEMETKNVNENAEDKVQEGKVDGEEKKVESPLSSATVTVTVPGSKVPDSVSAFIDSALPSTVSEISSSDKDLITSKA